MVTDKNRITAYVDNATFDALQAYCKENELSQSLAVAQLLQASLKIPHNLETDKAKIFELVMNEFDIRLDKRIEALREEVRREIQVSLKTSDIKSIDDTLDGTLSNIPSDTLNDTLDSMPDDTFNDTLDGTPSNIPSDTLADTLDSIPDDTLNDTLDSVLSDTLDDTLKELTNVELAGLLGVNRSTVLRWAKEERKPPKDLAWSYDKNSKLWIAK